MKKIRKILLLLVLTASSAMGQEKAFNLENHFTPYGFFRTYAIFDSRVSMAGSEDLFYYLPYDKTTNADGRDIYSNPSLKMYAITTRLGLNMKGYQFGATKVSGRIETDFYLMNGSTASLRLRQAYINLLWDNLANFDDINLKIGHAWHPMAADMPYCVNIESGSPFNPFARSPQVMMDARVNSFVFTAGFLYPMQYRPTGPLGASEDYIKYGLIPEAYAGISLVRPKFTARIGTDFISLRPRWKVTAATAEHAAGTRVNDRITMFNPFVYLQFNEGLLRINAKSVYANGGDHLRMMSGYALCDVSDPLDWKYAPLTSTVNYLSFSYGRKWQLMCMVGYMKALGTTRDLRLDADGYASDKDVYYFGSGFKNINQIVRVTPTLAYNAGKLTVAVEYDNTNVEYGALAKLNARGVASRDRHMVLNHRILGVVKFNF